MAIFVKNLCEAWSWNCGNKCRVIKFISGIKFQHLVNVVNVKYCSADLLRFISKNIVKGYKF